MEKKFAIGKNSVKMKEKRRDTAGGERHAV